MMMKISLSVLVVVITCRYDTHHFRMEVQTCTFPTSPPITLTVLSPPCSLFDPVRGSGSAVSSAMGPRWSQAAKRILVLSILR